MKEILISASNWWANNVNPNKSVNWIDKLIAIFRIIKS